MTMQAIPLRVQHPLVVTVLLILRITLSDPPIVGGHLLVLALVLPGVLSAPVLAC